MIKLVVRQGIIFQLPAGLSDWERHSQPDASWRTRFIKFRPTIREHSSAVSGLFLMVALAQVVTLKSAATEPLPRLPHYRQLTQQQVPAWHLEEESLIRETVNENVVIGGDRDRAQCSGQDDPPVIEHARSIATLSFSPQPVALSMPIGCILFLEPPVSSRSTDCLTQLIRMFKQASRVLEHYSIWPRNSA